MSDDTRGTIKEGEFHPAASEAFRWIKAMPVSKLMLWRESFASNAIEGNRLAEICGETLERIFNGAPVSDRYVLGLAWTLKSMTDILEGEKCVCDKAGGEHSGGCRLFQTGKEIMRSAQSSSEPDDSPEIRYPLSEEEKQVFRDRLEEVLSQTYGNQVVILWDKKRITDYYQNVCLPHVLDGIRRSATDYAIASRGELISLDSKGVSPSSNHSKE